MRKLIAISLLLCAGIAAQVVATKHRRVTASGAGSITDTVISSMGTIATGSGFGQQRHVIFDGTRWWAFYQKSGTADTLFYAYSTNLTSWTETSTALQAGSSNAGRKMDVVYDSGTATLIVTNNITPSDQPMYKRGVISGTTIAWSSNIFGVASPLADYGGANSITLDSNSKVHWAYANTSGNAGSTISSSVIGTTFADSGGGWNAWGNWASIVTAWTSIKVLPIASGDVLEIAGDSNRVISRFSASQTFGGNSSFTSQDPDHWAAVKLSNTDIRLIMAGPNGGTPTAWTCQTWGGSTWSSSAACPSWPTSGLAANSMVSSYTDGTNIYLYVIRGDSNKTVSVAKFNGSTWGSWVDISTGSGTGARAYVQAAAQANGTTLAVLWTETNGANYDLHVGGGAW